MPAGPWVVVVGMHRSGTSALAGALGALGFNQVRPGDRVEWSQSNPEHWESLSLGLFDEGLLHRLGGSWDAPPVLPRHWVHSASILGGGRRSRPWPRPSHSRDRPCGRTRRLCLLLPYWRTLLPEPPAAVFVWRNPLAVAHSLHRRDGMPLAVGLALWERYNRAALESLAGLDTFGVDFDRRGGRPHRIRRTVRRLARGVGPVRPGVRPLGPRSSGDFDRLRPQAPARPVPCGRRSAGHCRAAAAPRLPTRGDRCPPPAPPGSATGRIGLDHGHHRHPSGNGPAAHGDRSGQPEVLGHSGPSGIDVGRAPRRGTGSLRQPPSRG